MSDTRKSLVCCIVFLILWYAFIDIVGLVKIPGPSYPRTADFATFALIPLGAFLGAGYSRAYVLFTAYGGLASHIIWWSYFRSGQRGLWMPEPVVADFAYLSGVTVFLAAVSGLAARFRVALNTRFGPLLRCDVGRVIGASYAAIGSLFVTIMVFPIPFVRTQAGPSRWFKISYVSALVLVPLAVGIGFYRLRKPRSVNPDQCTTCGYNLTGNVSGVCPECGEATARPDPASP